ncbi:hypothetical protein VTJ04DRAFT_2244 [Mycothermus thermophilus]|uniref:uncharacterized protein n=1 Tax=Humicola insolens TaxID=85995 RepID=UPI003744339F
MGGAKRERSDDDATPPTTAQCDADDRYKAAFENLDGQSHDILQPPRKRQRLADASPIPPASTTPTTPTSAAVDRLSRLSDELLLRILSFLPLRHLLAVAPVSRRMYALSSDSQLWKALYYDRFVLPRAMRIPGIRDGLSGSGAGTDTASRGLWHKLHYAGRRMLSAEGRAGRRSGSSKEDSVEQPPPVNWKRQFKIRYNWARGKCAVEELRLGQDVDVDDRGQGRKRRMLVKVVEGIAVTADKGEGLRAWDLKTRSLIAQVGIGQDAAPSAIAVDEDGYDRGVLDVALGFDDGSFGVWRLVRSEKKLELRYRHEKSINGELIAMAFSYPYLLTATQAVLISLYTFNRPGADTIHAEQAGKLPPPYLLTSLDSHTSRPPLALSIRKTTKTTIASVAYTFSTRRGWALGIQDLHISQDPGLRDVITSRLAFANPIEDESLSYSSPTSPISPPRRRPDHAGGGHGAPLEEAIAAAPQEPGPTTLCYSHPYLLATLPDNTLVLHLCTSTATSLSISDGIRLWGHTSGISDAEITARGRAVSVSARGDEMRVWELEPGRVAASGAGRSVEIRPWATTTTTTSRPGQGEREGLEILSDDPAHDWDERRNWVGFDDEMVIVLKERNGARASLMVYDFT